TMLLKLYLLGAALAFMPLSTQPPGQQQENLFPYIDRDITNTTFPKDLNVTTNSDVVLVKCPDTDYRHKDNRETFSRNSQVLKVGSMFSPEGDLFAWVPLLKSKSGPTYLKCGRINLEDVGNPRYDWIFNVRWKNGTNDEGFFKRERSTINISPKHSKCNSGPEDLKIFGSKKEGGFSLINTPNIIPYIYANQTSKILSGRKNNFIKYYRGEKIILTKMKYVEKGLQDIENSNTLITSNFSINGYEIVKLTYYAPGEFQNDEITKTYYFAPSSNDLTINEKTVEYFKNETIRNPNCPLFYLNIGYLYKFKHNETEKDYSN
uniref:Ig-like domain-containing protein n=1 Tax=Strongyloides papillosus TaxID=174720 RepID=A0A0N5BQX4_STREA